MDRVARSVMWLLLLLPLWSCGSLKDTMRSLGRSAAQGVTDELPNMKAPLQKTLRDALLGDDMLKQLATKVTEATVRSVSEELARGELSKHVDALVAHAIETLGQKGSESTRQLIRTAGPELKEMLRGVVEQSLNAAGGTLRQQLQGNLASASAALAERTADALAKSLAKSLSAELKGALGDQLRQTAGSMGQQFIGSAANTLRDPTSQAAVHDFVSNAARGAVHGAKSGVNEGLPDRLQVALIAGILVMGALLFLCSVGLVLIVHRYRQSTKSLAIIAEKINQSQSPDLKQAIRRSADNNHVGPWLSSFLKARGL
jgi:hypothetical protein